MELFCGSNQVKMMMQVVVQKHSILDEIQKILTKDVKIKNLLYLKVPDLKSLVTSLPMCRETLVPRKRGTLTLYISNSTPTYKSVKIRDRPCCTGIY